MMQVCVVTKLDFKLNQKNRHLWQHSRQAQSQSAQTKPALLGVDHLTFDVEVGDFEKKIPARQLWIKKYLHQQAGGKKTGETGSTKSDKQ